MKLFLWTNVLRDYSPGVIFAVAETEEQAKELVMQHEDPEGVLPPSFVREEMDRNPPQVIEEPFGFWLWGGA